MHLKGEVGGQKQTGAARTHSRTIPACRTSTTVHTHQRHVSNAHHAHQILRIRHSKHTGRHVPRWELSQRFTLQPRKRESTTHNGVVTLNVHNARCSSQMPKRPRAVVLDDVSAAVLSHVFGLGVSGLEDASRSVSAKAGDAL